MGFSLVRKRVPLRGYRYAGKLARVAARLKTEMPIDGKR
jgi:hypothetical protein